MRDFASVLLDYRFVGSEEDVPLGIHPIIPQNSLEGVGPTFRSTPALRAEQSKLELILLLVGAIF
jgi:hypothetical protein